MNRPLAFLWRAADFGRRIGLFGCLSVPLLLLLFWFTRWMRDDPAAHFPGALAAAALAFLGCGALVVLSVTLKAYARKRGGAHDWAN